MASLRTPLKFMDMIMDKYNPENKYLFLHEELHDIWAIDPNGGNSPFLLSKRVVNLKYIKVDPKTADILYGKTE
jgi:hypothetical protein